MAKEILSMDNTTPSIINFELTPLEEAWMSALASPACGVVQCVSIQCACCGSGRGLPPCPSGEE